MYAIATFTEGADVRGVQMSRGQISGRGLADRLVPRAVKMKSVQWLFTFSAAATKDEHEVWMSSQHAGTPLYAENLHTVHRRT